LTHNNNVVKSVRNLTGDDVHVGDRLLAPLHHLDLVRAVALRRVQDQRVHAVAVQVEFVKAK
jgi:hypothetical protein